MHSCAYGLKVLEHTTQSIINHHRSLGSLLASDVGCMVLHCYLSRQASSCGFLRRGAHNLCFVAQSPILCDADGIAAMHAKFEAFKFTTWQGPPVGLKHAKLGSVCGCFAPPKQNWEKQKKVPLGNVCAAMVSNFHWC